MSMNGESYSGLSRIDALITNLSTCLVVPDVSPLNSRAECTAQLLAIYNQIFRTDHDDCWRQYEHSFSLNDVKEAIHGLDIKKDWGPMGISSNLIKYNVDELSPILLDMFNAILSTGIHPNSWKQSFLTPISLSEITNYLFYFIYLLFILFCLTYQKQGQPQLHLTRR